jgi:hypothetical protein
MKRVLLTMMLGLLVTAAACKKKDEAAKTDDKSAKTTDDKATPPAAGGEMTAADYETRNVAMMEKAASTFGAVGTDCDKGAAAVGKFFEDNTAEINALEAFEKAHPDVKKAVEDKNKDKTKAFEDSVGKVMDACKDNKAMQDAMKKMPG